MADTRQIKVKQKIQDIHEYETKIDEVLNDSDFKSGFKINVTYEVREVDCGCYGGKEKDETYTESSIFPLVKEATNVNIDDYGNVIDWTSIEYYYDMEPPTHHARGSDDGCYCNKYLEIKEGKVIENNPKVNLED